MLSKFLTIMGNRLCKKIICSNLYLSLSHTLSLSLCLSVYLLFTERDMVYQMDWFSSSHLLSSYKVIILGLFSYLVFLNRDLDTSPPPPPHGNTGSAYELFQKPGSEITKTRIRIPKPAKNYQLSISNIRISFSQQENSKI